MVMAAEVGITTTILWGIGGDMAALAVFPVSRDGGISQPGQQMKDECVRTLQVSCLTGPGASNALQ
jgi:hypothetical protein